MPEEHIGSSQGAKAGLAARSIRRYLADPTRSVCSSSRPKKRDKQYTGNHRQPSIPEAMQTAFNIALSILFLFVAAWVLVFGGIGSVLASARGETRMAGFLWGALAGPLGWFAVLWTTRSERRLNLRDALPSDASEATTADTTALPTSPVQIDVASEGNRL